MSRLPFLAQRLFNVPLAIHAAKAEVVIAALADRLGVAHMFRGNGAAVALSFEDDDQFTRPGRNVDYGYDVVAGVAVVPICGTLVQKTGLIRPYSGMQGYDSIRTAFCCAMEDPDVRAIGLDVDSPGGECASLFDLVDAIYAARGDKPIWAILNECAYSAAYALASAADYVTVPRIGGTGSMGVVCAQPAAGSA